MLFDRELIEIGRQVIKKWEDIYYHGGVDKGRRNCAYCIRYNPSMYGGNCVTPEAGVCPIAYFSGIAGCNKVTPYPRWLDEFGLGEPNKRVYDDYSRRAALGMLNYVKEIFVKSLLLLDLKDRKINEKGENKHNGRY